MKVIKHGNTVKELTCPDCGCIFTAAETDALNYRAEIAAVQYFYSCPECGHECGEEDVNNEQR